MSGVRLAVIGLGKLGLPVAAYYAHRGAMVTGVDISEQRVADINAGRSPIGPEPGMDEHLEKLVHGGRLVATTSYPQAVGEADTIIILVPLMTRGGQADFVHLDEAVRAIGADVGNDALVIFETTLPVGTTRHRFAPQLRGDRAGPLIAFSPERVSSGRIWRDLDTYPKLVGGVDDESGKAAASFYAAHLPAEVRRLSSSEAAELTKLAETTYRDVNIALANELAKFADEWGVDYLEVVESANSQPYSHIHRAGVGVGGHCIPHYPYLLQMSTRGSPLVAAARAINEEMPEWVVERVEAQTGDLKGMSVGLLGVAYRPAVPEAASSPAFGLRRGFEVRGAAVVARDPLFDDDELRSLGFEPWEDQTVDVIVLVTEHPEYRSLDWSLFPPALVVDGRNVLENVKVEGAGHRYIGVGR